MARVYCLDASVCALMSEDYPGTTRFHFQRELCTCQSRACLAAPGSSCAAAAAAINRSPSGDRQQVALIASSGGKAAVVLHPSAEPAELLEALAQVRPAGEANLAAALKLALLVSRRFPPSSTHVTAFVASQGAADSLVGADCSTSSSNSSHSSSGQHPTTAADLRQRFHQAAISLDVAVLCAREELGAAAVAALEELAGITAASSSSSSGGNDHSISSGACEPEGLTGANGAAGSSGPAIRLVWLAPVESAMESWQQLEPALEQLEHSRSSSSSSRADCSSATAAGASSGTHGSGGGSTHSALPACISRAPRQVDPLRHPRLALLAQRSGLHQPVLCRGESLNRLGHLSSDGMMRRWLPTYSSIAAQTSNGAGTGAAAASNDMGLIGSGRRDMCFVEVQPLPKYRTLIKVAAGRMLQVAEPAAAVAQSDSGVAADTGGQPGATSSSCVSPSCGGGGYAAASSQLLRSLEALNVPDETEGSSHGSNGSGSDSSGGSGAVNPPLRYAPDTRRGTLRLLQCIKESRQLKLVWSPDEPGSTTPAAGSTQPLDMFASSAGASSSSSSSTHSELLRYMPAAAVEASAARGPLLHEGCELWEAAGQHEWELELPAGASAAQTGVPSMPPLIEARQLPSGAQLLVVHAPAGGRCRSSSSSTTGSGGHSSLRQQARGAAAAVFWLQQRQLAPGDMCPPAYATVEDDAAFSINTATKTARQHQQEQQEEEEEQQQQQEAEQVGASNKLAQQEGSAELLVAALLGMLLQPPRVDLGRMRRDVKSGAIQVTSITVGPLPSQFVRDILATRSALMGSSGTENLDTWGHEDGTSSGGGGKGGSSSKAEPEGQAGTKARAGASAGVSSSSSSGRDASGAGSAAATGSAGGSGGAEGSSGGSSSGIAAAAMKQHKAALLSLLRQRLSSQDACADSGGSGAGESAAALLPAGTGGAASEGCTSQARKCSLPPRVLGNGTPPSAATAATPVPCSPQLAPLHAAASPCSYGSSGDAGTPFGTPLHILPDRLLHGVQAGDSELSPGGDAGAEGPAADMAAAGAEQPPCVTGVAGAGLKREPSVLMAMGAGRQGGDADSDSLFQLE